MDIDQLLNSEISDYSISDSEDYIVGLFSKGLYICLDPVHTLPIWYKLLLFYSTNVWMISHLVVVVL